MKTWRMLTILCLLAKAPCVLAQANQTVESHAQAGSLQGIVFYSSADRDEKGLEDVAVAECNADFKNCVPITRTDKNGHFAIQSTRKGNTHYLQFLKPNWCEGLVVVTLAHSSKRLKVKLFIGT
ncbi:hypothetical protein [Tunturiibacter lichenicola]|uniref:hypothetical protein n=1 Tax=Tunturiibacter lichenicola TaxID=2051959 RepID=UPI003D9B5BAB